MLNYSFFKILRIARLVFLRLPDGKRNLIQARLQDRLHQLQCRSFSNYYEIINQDGQGREKRWCIEQLTTNETYFSA